MPIFLRTRRDASAASGTAQVRRKINVTVASATESAKAKISEAGGSVVEPTA